MFSPLNDPSSQSASSLALLANAKGHLQGVLQARKQWVARPFLTSGNLPTLPKSQRSVHPRTSVAVNVFFCLIQTLRCVVVYIVQQISLYHHKQLNCVCLTLSTMEKKNSLNVLINYKVRDLPLVMSSHIQFKE